MDLLATIFNGVDMQFMPKCIEARYAEHDLWLLRLEFIPGLYPVYSTTYKQVMSRDVTIRDEYDMIAYMLANSSVTVDLEPRMKILVDRATRELRSTASSVARLDAQVQTDMSSSTQVAPSLSELLVIHGLTPSTNAERSLAERNEVERSLTEHTAMMSSLLSKHRTIIEYIKELHDGELATINAFISSNSNKLNELIPIIGKELNLVTTQRIRLYKSLTIAEQLEIANGDWMRIDMRNKPASYILFVRIMFNRMLEPTLYARHPHLIVLSGDLNEMAKLIVSKCDEDEMRMAAAIFTSIASIDEAELLLKCLALMHSSSTSTSTTAWR